MRCPTGGCSIKALGTGMEAPATCRHLLRCSSSRARAGRRRARVVSGLAHIDRRCSDRVLPGGGHSSARRLVATPAGGHHSPRRPSRVLRRAASKRAAMKPVIRGHERSATVSGPMSAGCPHTPAQAPDMTTRTSPMAKASSARVSRRFVGEPRQWLARSARRAHQGRLVRVVPVGSCRGRKPGCR